MRDYHIGPLRIRFGNTLQMTITDRALRRMMSDLG